MSVKLEALRSSAASLAAAWTGRAASRHRSDTSRRASRCRSRPTYCSRDSPPYSASTFCRCGSSCFLRSLVTCYLSHHLPCHLPCHWLVLLRSPVRSISRCPLSAVRCLLSVSRFLFSSWRSLVKHRVMSLRRTNRSAQPPQSTSVYPGPQTMLLRAGATCPRCLVRQAPLPGRLFRDYLDDDLVCLQCGYVVYLANGA
jgi:hypothetical protein